MYSPAARCKRVASTRPRLTTTAHHSYHTTPYDAYHIRICLPLPHPNGYFMRSLDSGCILASGLRNKARRSVGTIVAHSVETAGRRLRGAQIIARHKQRTPSHGHLEDPEAEENGRLHAPDCTALGILIGGISTLVILLSTRARGLMVFMVSIMVVVGFQDDTRTNAGRPGKSTTQPSPSCTTADDQSHSRWRIEGERSTDGRPRPTSAPLPGGEISSGCP
jgi:hypothetical protein